MGGPPLRQQVADAAPAAFAPGSDLAGFRRPRPSGVPARAGL